MSLPPYSGEGGGGREGEVGSKGYEKKRERRARSDKESLNSTERKDTNQEVKKEKRKRK